MMGVDVETAGSEPALSAAVPVAWLPARRWEQMTAAEPWLTNVVYSEDQSKFFPCVPLYAAPPAPSVAVKALEWVTDENHSVLQRADFYTIESEFRQGFALHTAGVMGVQWFPTEAEVKAAAQADYEARIRSALSAQVQDVAGLDADDVIDKLAAMPCETQGPEDLEAGCCRTCRARSIRTALDEPYDPVNFPPHPLDAAPAKQEASHVTSQ